MLLDEPALDIIVRGVVLGTMAMLWIVLLVRITGLRSFSKMTSFDFVMTVAMGSLLAGAAQASSWAGFGQAIAAMAGLFVLQWLLARMRKSSDVVEVVLQNEPVLLMRNGEFCEDAMQRTRVARSDVLAKLREANVLAMSEVRAVVLETTGDVSVLHGDRLEPAVMQGVQGADPDQ